MKAAIANNTYQTRSAEETLQYAIAFGSRLPPKATLTFSGDLGAGKTTFIRGLAEGAAKIDPREVSSPTYTYLHIYEGTQKIYHFDLYRLPSAQEFLASGFEDYIDTDGICCIEWAEKITPFLPQNSIHIDISYIGEETRKITITGHTNP